MTLRAARMFGKLLLSALPASGGELVPTVVGVHQSPGDLRSICIVAENFVATTAGGGRWSVAVEDLEAAVRRPSPSLRPRWFEAQSRDGGPCRRAGAPILPIEVDGYPVTAGATLAGTSYLGTFGGGIRLWSGGHVASTPPDIHDLAVVGEHLVMAHTGGLSTFDGDTVTPIELAGPPASDITALEWVDDTLWVGSFDRGLARLRGEGWQRAGASGEHGAEWINGLCWDGATLWVGSAAGLGLWDPIGDRVVPVTEVEGRVQSIRCTDQEVVVATAAAVWIGRDGMWQEVGLAGEALHTAIMVGGELWAAGLRGILRRRGDDWVRYAELNGELPDSWVTALLPHDGSMFAGTYDAGLLRLDRSGRWRTVLRDAWVNPNAMAVLRSGVAVGTMGDGLLLYDATARRWGRLTSSAGLPSDDITALRAVGDTLWVGTRAGIAEVRWLGRE